MVFSGYLGYLHINSTKKILIMRNFTISFLFLMSLVLLVGCSEDDSTENITDTYMSAVIDGTNYQMTGMDSELTAKKLIGPSGILKLQVSASSSHGQHIKFVVANYMGEGIYIVGENPMLPTFIELGNAQPYGLWSCHNPGPSDTEKNFIQITLDDGKVVEGKFDFSGQNFEDNSMRKVKEGKFKIQSD